jgi:hypothetical protein
VREGDPAVQESTMSWTSEELSAIGRAEELQLASFREDGTLRPYVTIWVVCVGDELYVRSARGPASSWYQRALRGGRVRAGGLERDVLFTAAPPGVNADVDAAYHAKYDRYGAAIVGSVIGKTAGEATVRLTPRN